MGAGITLRAAVRLMISSEFSSKFDAIDDSLSRTILPIFWLEMSREATESQVQPIKTDLYRALEIRDNLRIAAMALTLAFAIMTGLYSIRVLEQCLIRKRRRTTAAVERDAHDRAPFALAL